MNPSPTFRISVPALALADAIGATLDVRSIALTPEISELETYAAVNFFPATDNSL